MKDVNLKDLKMTGVSKVCPDGGRHKKDKPVISSPVKQKKFVRQRKDMILNDDKSGSENNRDRHQQMNEYLFYNYKVSGIHIYAIETKPVFKAELFIGDPLDNEALIMSYYAHNNTEVLTSALGVYSPEIKSRMITQMYIDSVDFKSFINKTFLIIFDSMILEAFRNEKKRYCLMEYTHKLLTLKLKRGRC